MSRPTEPPLPDGGSPAPGAEQDTRRQDPLKQDPRRQDPLKQEPRRQVPRRQVPRQREMCLLDLVLGAVPHMVWWKGADQRYTGCNEAYLELRGLTDRAQLIGRPEDELGLDDEIGPHLTRLERTVLDGGQGVSGVKVNVDESRRTLQFSLLPCPDGEGAAGVIGVGMDISHVTHLERQLAQANRLEAIGQLAAGIAHEINTPVQYASDNTRFVADSVSQILAGLQDLERLMAEPDALPAGGARERLQRILEDLDLEFVADEVPSALSQSLEGLDRVTQIVRAMKEFSHPGQDRALADLNQLIVSTTQVSRNEWKYVAELELDLDPAVGMVPCFGGDLKQVVLNIVVNAAHAINERRRLQKVEQLGRIVVASRRVGDEIRITITDNGIGMDEQTQQRVFEPFFTTKEVGKGTGQGLALARTAMDKHDGRIEITSTFGEGSSFALVLPAGDPCAALAGTGTAAQEPAGAVAGTATPGAGGTTGTGMATGTGVTGGTPSEETAGAGVDAPWSIR